MSGHIHALLKCTKGRGTDMSSAFVRWSARLAQSSGQNVVLLFLDIQSAYYSVIHALLGPRSFDDASLDEILDELDIPIAVYKPLERMLDAPGAISLTVCDPHVQSMLLDSVRNVCNATREGQQLAQARCGTGPGEPPRQSVASFL